MPRTHPRFNISPVRSGYQALDEPWTASFSSWINHFIVKHMPVNPKVRDSRPLTYPTLFACKFKSLPCFFLSAPILWLTRFSIESVTYLWHGWCLSRLMTLDHAIKVRILASQPIIFLCLLLIYPFFVFQFWTRSFSAFQSILSHIWHTGRSLLFWASECGCKKSIPATSTFWSDSLIYQRPKI